MAGHYKVVREYRVDNVDAAFFVRDTLQARDEREELDMESALKENGILSKVRVVTSEAE